MGKLGLDYRMTMTGQMQTGRQGKIKTSVQTHIVKTKMKVICESARK